MKIKDNIYIIKSIGKISLKFLRRYPRIFIPFMLVAIVNTFNLLIIYLAPMAPFRMLLGPPIARFYGVQYLHYPYNFMLLPRIFFNAAAFLTNPLITGLMIACACGMVCDYYTSREPSFLRNLNKSLRRFIHIFPAMLIMVIMTSLIFHFIPLVLSKIFSDFSGLRILSFFLTFFIVIGLESFFIYTFLIIILKKVNAFKAIKESFLFSRRLFFVTYILVLLPRLLDLGASVLQRKQAYLMDKFIPDIILLILFLGIIVTVLSDTLIYILISNLYLLKEGSKDLNANLEKDAENEKNIS